MGGHQRVIKTHRLKGQNIEKSSRRTYSSANVIYTCFWVLQIWMVRWMSHVTRYVSSRNCVFNSTRFAEIYEKKIWMYHIKKLKHKRRGVTVVNCDGHSRTTGSVQELGGETRRPGGVSVSCLVNHICRECLYIYFFFTVLYMSYYVKLFGSIPNSRQSPPWLLEKIIWNCDLSSTAGLYTVITHNVTDRVPILWFDSLFLNNPN